MATEPHAHAQTPRYETRDASPRGLLIFFVFIGIFLLATSIVVAWFFGHLTKTDILPSATSQPFENARPLPPAGAPLLQAEPTIDIQHYVESQRALLNSYGWVDRQQGVVRIPIDRAMEELSQKGFPVRSQQDGSPAAPPRTP